MRNTIALFASSRRYGNTGKLMDRIADELNVEVVDLSGMNISPFDYQHRNRGDDFEPLMNRILGFQNVVFASPIYWYAVSPPMKVFLDRISDYLDLPDLLDKGRKLRGKSGFVVCTSVYAEPSDCFIDAFSLTFDYLGMRYGGHIHANCRNGYRAEEYEEDIRAFIKLVGGA